MKSNIELESISLTLSEEGEAVRVESAYTNIYLANQKLEDIESIILHNFSIVTDHYKAKGADNYKDISNISISIVLHYLYMYNLWKNTYKSEKKRDLRFIDADFENPTTHDIIFSYFKSTYPSGWDVKCAVLLEMELEDLYEYYVKRKNFHTK